MFEDMGSNIISTEANNAPNLAFTATPIMGNLNFAVMAPETKGEVHAGYPSFPYLGVESLLYFQMMSNPMRAPYTAYSGSNTGQQVISGQYTMQDPTGTSRYQMGFQSSGG